MAPKDPALPAACELDHDLSEFISKGRSDPDCPRDPHAGGTGFAVDMVGMRSPP